MTSCYSCYRVYEPEHADYHQRTYLCTKVDTEPVRASDDVPGYGYAAQAPAGAHCAPARADTADTHVHAESPDVADLTRLLESSNLHDCDGEGFLETREHGADVLELSAVTDTVECTPTWKLPDPSAGDKASALALIGKEARALQDNIAFVADAVDRMWRKGSQSPLRSLQKTRDYVEQATARGYTQAPEVPSPLQASDAPSVSPRHAEPHTQQLPDSATLTAICRDLLCAPILVEDYTLHLAVLATDSSMSARLFSNIVALAHSVSDGRLPPGAPRTLVAAQRMIDRMVNRAFSVQ